MAFWRAKVAEDLVKKATDGYIKAYQSPTLVSARFDSADSVTSLWSQLSPQIGKKRQFSKFLRFDDGEETASFPCPGDGVESLSCFKSARGFCLSKVKNAKGDDTDIFEILSKTNIEKTINITDLDLAGSVYYDTEFGSLAVNPSGTMAAFIAEKKKAKTWPFFPNSKPKDDYSGFGQEFKYTEEFGEQLVGKSEPVIVLVDLETDETRIADHSGLGGLCPGQLEWISDDTLAGVALDTKPYKIGVIYCSNRPSTIFTLNTTSSDVIAPVKPIGKFTCKLPIASPDGKTLLWMETDLSSSIFPGPHQQCFRLMSLNMESMSEKVVIDIKQKFDPEADDFAGFYVPSTIPIDCFVTPQVIVLNTVVDGTNYPMVINVESGNFAVAKELQNVTVLAMRGSNFVALKHDCITPPHLIKGEVAPASLSLTYAGQLTTPMFIDLPFEPTFKKLLHNPPDESGLKFSSIYVGPGEGEKVPLIVFPHGGPHGSFTTSFSNDIYYFLSEGFAVLMINYRGSTTQGKAGVDSLPGKVGDQDVKDCYQAFQECLQEFPFLDGEKAVLFGGSHGGFLVTHLVGQYPDAFKACVARNPVINIATMSTVSDISDWTFNESGLPFLHKSPNATELKTMLEKSPIFHVDKVKAPVYLMIGKDDLRVPPSQGLEYFHNMKALGKDVDMSWYADNHPLGKVGNHSDVFINTVLFYKSVLEIH